MAEARHVIHQPTLAEVDAGSVQARDGTERIDQVHALFHGRFNETWDTGHVELFMNHDVAVGLYEQLGSVLSQLGLIDA